MYSKAKHYGSSLVALAVASMIPIACRSHLFERPPPEPAIIKALFDLDQGQDSVNDFTEQFLNGNLRLDLSWLRDWRKVPIYIRVGTPGSGEGLTHLRVATVSDYFLCLLEIKYDMPSEQIIAEWAPHLTPVLEGCGACCSEIFPLTDEVRERLADYWCDNLPPPSPP